MDMQQDPQQNTPQKPKEFECPINAAELVPLFMIDLAEENFDVDPDIMEGKECIEITEDIVKNDILYQLKGCLDCIIRSNNPQPSDPEQAKRDIMMKIASEPGQLQGKVVIDGGKLYIRNIFIL